MSRFRRWIVYLCGQCIFIFLILLGFYGEIWRDSLENLKDSVLGNPAPTSVEKASSDDPGLLNFVGEGQLAILRADLSNLTAFNQWQVSFRNFLVQSIFGLPEIADKNEVYYELVSAENPTEKIYRQFIFFKSFDGTRIPAYILKPRILSSDSAKVPAILFVSGHVREKESGIEQLAGLVSSYQHKAAMRMAEAGFVTMTFELRGFGLLGAPFNIEHRLVAYNAILGGSFYKSIISRDIQFAVNLLQSLPEVDLEKIGIAGVSFGGEMAVTYAALDTRIKAVVFQGFGGRIGPFQGVEGDADDQPHYCHIIPGSKAKIFQEDFFYLLAPRPVLGVKGTTNLPFDSIFSRQLGKAWDIYGASHLLELQTVEGGHEFFINPTKIFFQRYLKGKSLPKNEM